MVRGLGRRGLLKSYQDKMETFVLQRGKCISRGVSWGTVGTRVQNCPCTPAWLSSLRGGIHSPTPFDRSARMVAFPSHLWQVSSVCCGVVRVRRGSWESWGGDGL